MSDSSKVNPRLPTELLLILAGALILRVIYLYCYAALPDWEQLTVDNYYHHNWAQSLAGGNWAGDTTYFRAPFYVWCLGSLYAFFGSSLWVARLFGTFAGLATVVVTYLLARKIYDHRTGLIAATLYACLPTPLYFEAEILLDPLFTCLFAASVYLLLDWQDRASLRSAILAGLMIGLAAITRPTALVLWPVIVVAFPWRTVSLRGRGKQMVLIAAACAAVIAITFTRNLIVAGDPVLISSQGGINLYLGNNEQADGVSAAMPEPYGHNWQIKQITYLAEQEAGRSLRPGEVSAHWIGEAVDWISERPTQFLLLYFEKLVISFSNSEISNNRPLSDFFGQIFVLKWNPLSFGLLLGLAVMGMLLAGNSRRQRWFVALTILTYTAAIALFFFNSRFRLPLLPLYAVLASGGIMGIFRTARANRRRALAATALAGVVMLVSFWQPVRITRGPSPQPEISEGLHWFSAGSYARALDHFQAALEIDGSFPEANLNAGACYLRRGDLKSADACFAREIEYNPERHKAYVNRASIQQVRGSYTEARILLDRALELAPWDTEANLLYLRLAAVDNNYVKLKEAVNLAAARTDYDIFVLNEAAILLTESGQLDAADQILRQALTSSPPPVETNDALFTRSYRNSPNDWNRQVGQAHYQLGFVNGIQGRFGEAIKHSRSAIERDSTLVDAYVNLVAGLTSTSRQKEADSVLQDALLRFPGHPSLSRLSP
jgi:4-amino-4-deoxy-L-arabinose transferase-like glycosyltransferase